MSAGADDSFDTAIAEHAIPRPVRDPSSSTGHLVIGRPERPGMAEHHPSM
ncbi:hypothetical protein [Streptomyces yangpuensis]